ncbi:MAG: hypothetical protein IKY83_10680 [Proteobacteria bacterium]|nr:hypothetical protein [Pseudomonadota bacterium]
MQEVLNSLFGPATGLIGMALLVIMLLPKIVVRVRGRRARRRSPSQSRPKQLGLRRMALEAQSGVEGIGAHADHGEALAVLRGSRIRPIVELFLCVVPLIAVLMLVPEGRFSLRMILLVVTVPLALMGLLSLRHLWDRVVFYRTGFVGRLSLKNVSHDYNEICEVTERKGMIPNTASSYILHLDDGSVMELDGGYLEDGRRLKRFWGSLDARVVVNASEEKLRAG